MVRIISRLSSQIARRGVSKGTVVIGTSSFELHVLPLMIAADLIRLEGFEVLDLGCNLPADSFAEIVAKQQRLIAVGVSATSPDQVADIRATIDALRAAIDVPIFLGGSAINGGDHARLLGADFGGPRISDVIAELVALAG
jgi:methanogenic corrinoid protein MtbC1